MTYIDSRATTAEEEAAWALYCRETAGGVNFWTDLSEKTQQLFLARVRVSNAMLVGELQHLTSAGGTSVLLRDLEDVYFPFPPDQEY